jgi:cytidylate kinase
MKRISLVVAAALACLAVAGVGTAAAMPTEGIVNTSCSTSSNFVAGHKLTATVTGKNVDPSQMKYAECKIVKKVLNQVIKKEVEKPTVIEGFRITPSITSEAPLVVKYTGLFRGADTATEIKLKFKIAYANN